MPTLLGASLAALALIGAGMAPAQAAAPAAVAATAAPASGARTHPSHWHTRDIQYVNLGDSYSAGFGSGTVKPGTIPGCLQGTGPSHVTRLAALPGMHLTVDASCAGATPADITAIAGAIRTQLATADLVTLTLGGNDLDLAGLVLACSTLGNDTDCDRALAVGHRALPSITASARTTLHRIDASTPARILVLGYPRLFSPQYGDTALVTARHARQLNRLADGLNRAVRAATRGTHARFIPVTGAFNRHGLGSRTSWIYFNTGNLGDPFNMHPTTTGYLRGYYPAVLHRIGWHHRVR